MTVRLDVYLTERALAPSRRQAADMIRAGRVTVDGIVALKPSRLVSPETEISVVAEQAYVSRGGQKLEHALDRFGIDPGGLSVLDAGASTGGFTECLLRRGAKRVWAVDVGHGQLAQSLRDDPRVTVMEGVNARELTPERLGGLAELATVDVSFISQKLIWPALIGCLTEQAGIVSLIKPQFEAGRAAVGKGGIVRDPKARRRVVAELSAWGESLGLTVCAVMESPILGGDGNQEFLMFLRKGSP